METQVDDSNSMELNGEENEERKVVTLPEDLQIEILTMLPAKSLMRFRCVQQSWNSLFRTPTFVTKHMHKSIFHDRFIIFDSADIALVCKDPSQPPQQIELPFARNKSVRWGRIYSHGPCNGIFCLDVYHIYHKKRYVEIGELILWNPATTEFKVLPPSPHNIPSCDNFFNGDRTYNLTVFHGFGVDRNTNTFKVVSLLTDRTDKCCGPVTSAEVYDLSTNSWTVIRDNVVLASVTEIRASKTCNGFVDGVYHWLIGGYYSHAAGSSRDILCFDFRNNEFHKLKSPILVIPDSVGSNIHDDIAEVNDFLAYVVQYNKVRFEIWIWNNDSWTKRYNIGPVDGMDCFYCIWKDGAEILGANNWEPLVSANSDAVRQFQINLDPICQIHRYVESVAPLSV